VFPPGTGSGEHARVIVSKECVSLTASLCVSGFGPDPPLCWDAESAIQSLVLPAQFLVVLLASTSGRVELPFRVFDY